MRGKKLLKSNFPFIVFRTQMISLVKERFLTISPLSPKPPVPPPPYICQFLPFPSVLMSWGADSSNGATELQPGYLQLWLPDLLTDRLIIMIITCYVSLVFFASREFDFVLFVVLRRGPSLTIFGTSLSHCLLRRRLDANLRLS